MPYTAQGLKEIYPTEEERKQLLRLIAIQEFMTDSILPTRYRVPARLTEPIVLTAAGEEYSKRLVRGNFKWPEVRLACFLAFSHHELLVDHTKTNLTGLISELNAELTTGKILHPFIWGREMYDKAFEVFNHEPVSLDEKQTTTLLRDAPRGVWQSFDLVTGPLGILYSQGIRALTPTISVPLYHCEKRSCRTVHRTNLATTESQIHKTRGKLREFLDKDHERDHAFGEFFTEIDNEFCDYYGDRRSMGEIPLVGECFSTEDLNAVLLTALSGKHSPLRSALAANKVDVRNPQDFIDTLDKAGKIQALMLIDSENLTGCIDESIHNNLIKIPAHEIRRPKILDISTGYYDLSAECSKYGVRVMPIDRSLAVVRLNRLISSIYDPSSASARRDLEWRLRRVEGESIDEKLDRYVRSEEPSEVLRHLVLVGPEPFSVAAEKCGVASTIRLERMEDSDLLNILLWKLGFDVREKDEAFGPLRRNLEVFAQAASTVTSYSDQERYEIRRESSPLFSSIEAALDATLAFTTWSLTYDHWSAQSRFTYHHASAREQMAKVLNARTNRSPSLPNETVIYDSQGRNTLFPLISGFSRLREYLTQVLDNADQYRRPEEDMPLYAKLAALTPFAFNHSLPFLDLSSESQRQIIALLTDMTRLLDSGGVANVRNKLQHSRDDFPARDELSEFLNTIGRFLEIAEESGLCPVIFRPAGNYRDSSGRASFQFTDYRNREYTAYRPSGIGSPGMPGLRTEQFIVPLAKLRDSGEVLRFSIGTESTYNEVWEEWPKYWVSADRKSDLMRPTDDTAQAS
ncbi:MULTISPECIES: hypothetical protein [unclassified Streptomyces]|uniref:hypothetical protein n=1 Tax=unclassified Streptomyces TaxID=2593676 RepID=UPI0029AFE391|nr:MULTISPECIES: hypothetical protein [unclassified Streptomyces]MDX3433707.1 hypothetical protein [Streptomyces sp. ME01-18a]MDX3686480.1 hypothetical protein [Streptomyces sp. AK04-4c]